MFFSRCYYLLSSLFICCTFVSFFTSPSAMHTFEERKEKKVQQIKREGSIKGERGLCKKKITTLPPKSPMSAVTFHLMMMLFLTSLAIWTFLNFILQVGSYSYDMTKMIFRVSKLTFIQKQSIVLVIFVRHPCPSIQYFTTPDTNGMCLPKEPT